MCILYKYWSMCLVSDVLNVDWYLLLNDVCFSNVRECLSYVLFEIFEFYLVFSECTLISCCQELNLPIYGNVNIVTTFLCGLDMPLSGEEVPPSLTWSVHFFEKIASKSEYPHLLPLYITYSFSKKYSSICMYVST